MLLAVGIGRIDGTVRFFVPRELAQIIARGGGRRGGRFKGVGVCCHWPCIRRARLGEIRVELDLQVRVAIQHDISDFGLESRGGGLDPMLPVVAGMPSVVGVALELPAIETNDRGFWVHVNAKANLRCRGSRLGLERGSKCG